MKINANDGIKHVYVLDYINTYNNSTKKGKLLLVENNNSYNIVNLTNKEYDTIKKNYQDIFLKSNKSDQHFVPTGQNIKEILGIEINFENRYKTVKEFQENIKPNLDANLAKNNMFKDIIKQIENPEIKNGVPDYSSAIKVIKDLGDKSKKIFFIDYLDLDLKKQEELSEKGFSKDVLKEYNNVRTDNFNSALRICQSYMANILNINRGTDEHKLYAKNLIDKLNTVSKNEQTLIIKNLAERFETLPTHKDDSLLEFLQYNKFPEDFIKSFVNEKRDQDPSFSKNTEKKVKQLDIG